MHIVFSLALFAASFTILTSAMAQSWEVQSETDPFTDEVKSMGATVENEDGGLNVGCAEDIGILVGAHFNDAAEELDSPEKSEAGKEARVGKENPPSLTIKWRINKGKVLEFTTVHFDGSRYVVLGPMGVELARMLVDARQFVTSNGGAGASERILLFEDLDGREQIERVLQACGH